MKGPALIAAALAGALGVVLGTSPAHVRPPFLPPGSTVREVPPWPLFRLLSGLRAVLAAAAEATTPPDVRALDLTTAYWKMEVVHALVRQGVLAAIPPEGATASAVGESLGLHVPFLARHLHTGSQLGLLRAPSRAAAEPRYTLTPVGATLRADAPSSLRDFALVVSAPYNQAAWRAAGERSLTSGRSGMAEAHGSEIWDFYEARPEDGAHFDGTMTSLTETVAPALLAGWKPPASAGGLNGTVCDLGGGHGTLLALWLQHYPHARGILLDQPSVVPRAAAFLAARGLSERASVVGGSFLQPLPAELSAACDIFLLKQILHDWPDAQAATILAHAAAAAKPGAVVANLDAVLVPGASGPAERAKALFDVNMLAVTPAGARERSAAHFEALYARAGLPKPTVVPLRNLFSLVVATVPERE